jgi:hypothetical protein
LHVQLWGRSAVYWCGRQLARIGNKIVIELGSTLVIGFLVAHFALRRLRMEKQDQ